MIIRLSILIVMISFVFVGCTESQNVDTVNTKSDVDTTRSQQEINLTDLNETLSSKIDDLGENINTSLLKTKNNLNSDITNISYLIVFNILILLAITGLVVFLLKSMMKSMFRSQIFEIHKLLNNIKPVENHSNRAVDNSIFNRKLEEVMEQINELKILIEHSQNFDIREKINTNKKLINSDGENISSNDITEVKEIKYFPIPNAVKKGFDIKNGISTLDPGNSIYKLEIYKKFASIEVCDNWESVQTALNNVSSYLDIICDSENEPRKGYTHITTIEKGQAELKGDMWYINKPVKIKYE